MTHSPSLSFSLATLLSLGTLGCAVDGPDDNGPDDLRATLCGEGGLDCSDGGKADTITSLVSSYFDHDGDLAAAGGQPVERYRARMRGTHTVRDEDGKPLSGLGALAHCGWSPEDCSLSLTSSITFAPGVSTKDVLDALYGDPRLYWRHAQIVGDFHVDAASAPGPGGALYNGTHYAFQPIGRSVANLSLVDLDVTLSPPRPIAGGFAIPVHVAGGTFACPTAAPCITTTIVDRGTGVELAEAWDGVKVTGGLRRFPAVAAVLHRWALESNPILKPLMAFDPRGGETGWVGLADFLEARDHAELGALAFADQIHDNPGDALQVRSDAQGRYITGGTMVDRIDATPEAVIAALQGDWSCWWAHGRVENRVVLRDASGNVTGQSYDLTPLDLAPMPPLTKVHEVMSAPKDLGNGHWRIDIQLQGWPGSGGGNSFAGPAHFDIERLSDGATRVIGRFDQVRPLGVFAMSDGLARLATRLHQMAEQGTMPPPARGTGLPGLVRLVALGEAAKPGCVR